MRPVTLRELLSIRVDVRPVVDLGGGRRYVPFDGGTFEGRDGLRGTILEGGVDWQTARADGVLEIDAHYTLSTDAGERIEVRSTGLRGATTSIRTSTTSGPTCGSPPPPLRCRGSTTCSPCRRGDETSRWCA
jgi:hypothetical protein